MTTFDRARPLRQSMSWLHTWSGLTLGWLLFVVYVTGTLSYFRNEITFWMQPELHRARVAAPERIAYDRALALLAREAPDARQWTITLPGTRNPTLGLGWQSPPAENRQPGAGAAPERPASREDARKDARDADGGRRENRGIGQGAAALAEQAKQAAAAPPRHSAEAQRQSGGGGHRGPRLLLDPASGHALEGRATAGGDFLYYFHFELYGMDRMWGRWIVGIATMFMFVALVSGVIVHRRIFKDFFTFRPGKGKRSWLDAHNASSVLSLPFHLIITFSGLVLFGNMMMPTAFHSAYQGNVDAYREAMRARMTPSETPSPSGQRAPLTDLAALVAAARDVWGGEPVGSIAITLPGDRNAVVELRQMHFPGLTGGRNIPTLRFDGVTGEPLATPAVREPSAVQAAGSTLNLLHRGFFATPVPRWLLFLSGVGGSLMIASGLVLWSISRAGKTSGTARAAWGRRLVDSLNITSIAGLMVAIAVYFWANRLIPGDLPARADWEVRAFFIAWIVTLVHAIVRRPKAAWVEQLAGAGGLSALLPLVNAATGGLALPDSVGRGLGLLAGFDLGALAIGAGLLFAAHRVRCHVPRVRLAASPSSEIFDPGAETAPGTSLSEAVEKAT
jgi:uncharacterized iron-regulated membrane protein